MAAKKKQSVVKSQDENSDSEEAILQIARDRFQNAEKIEAQIRKDARDDIKFSIGDQWPDDIKRQRELEKRPCLTINLLPNRIHQITNDQRQNRPSIKVSPVDDKSDIETAKILQGIVRHIEYSSDADTAYDRAFDSAVRGGFGFFRVVTEYADPYSFEQEIRIKSIRNRFSAYLDPHYQKPDGSDAVWGTVFEKLNEDEFKSQYPNAKLSNMTDWEAIGSRYPQWIQKGSCRVAEYFTKTFKEVEIVLLKSGKVLKKEEYEKLASEKSILLKDDPVTNTRKTIEPAIKWYKHNGFEILDETDWLGQWIPIIPVLGDEIEVDGVRVLEGLVRHAKDSQRQYNFLATAQAETIALAPKAPWIGYEGQFEGHEAAWKSANTRNHPYLQIKPMTVGGQPAPLPQRNVYEPPTQAVSQARMLASEDLKAATGIYDASLGAGSVEKSGIAIQRRNIQAQTSNFHFIDNLSKSIRHCGRILVDLIPKVYDTPRAVRILGEDDSEEIIKINQMFTRKGEQVNYALNLGKYDVTVSTGPSYQTKRQEAAAAMLDLSKSAPQLMTAAPDLMVKALDIPDAEILANRLKKTLPPGLADDDKNKKPLPPQVQAQLQQMNQMIDGLTKELQAANDTIKNKTLELESKERIEMSKIQANAEIELAKLGSKEAQVLLLQEIRQIERRMDLLHQNQPIENESAPGETESPAAPNENVPQQQPTGGIPPGSPMGV